MHPCGTSTRDAARHDVLQERPFERATRGISKVEEFITARRNGPRPAARRPARRRRRRSSAGPPPAASRRPLAVTKWLPDRNRAAVVSFKNSPRARAHIPRRISLLLCDYVDINSCGRITGVNGVFLLFVVVVVRPRKVSFGEACRKNRAARA